jgi:hypothetical protein
MNPETNVRTHTSDFSGDAIGQIKRGPDHEFDKCQTNAQSCQFKMFVLLSVEKCEIKFVKKSVASSIHIARRCRKSNILLGKEGSGGGGAGKVEQA